MSAIPVIILHFANIDLDLIGAEASLDAKILLWERTAFGGYILVILGVVIESAELFLKWSHRRKTRTWIGEIFERKRRRRVVAFARWLKPKVLPVETFGFALLVFGLGLELLAGQIAGGYQEQKIGQLNEKAATAIKQSGEANQAAAESRERAAKLELAAAELEMAMAPRVFRPKPEAFERLKQFSGTKFMVASKPDPENPYSREIPNLAGEIFLNLTYAGWVPVTNVAAATLEWLSDGVEVESSVGMAEEMKAAWALAEMLESRMVANKQATGKHPGVVVIVVGKKPDLAGIRLKELSDDWQKESLNEPNTDKLRAKLIEIQEQMIDSHR